MGLFDALNISATGLNAQGLRLDVISNNLANGDTTRTPEGGPFRKSYVVMRPRNHSLQFKSHFLPEALKHQPGRGVEIVSIKKSPQPARLKYDPGHPDAIQFGEKKGYVLLPNVNVVEEMVNMISVQRSYEANVTMMNSAKQMFMRALEIGL